MCYTPRIIKIRGEDTGVPCGKCPKCVSRHVSGWSFRLMQEDKKSTSAYFITLTYDTNNVPISSNGFMQLDKTEVQKFFKRVRKLHEEKKQMGIKYFVVGEYGGSTERPHYHIILFNAKLELMLDKKDIRLLEIMGYDGKVNVQCKQWDKGHITVGKVTGASVGYTLKYISKKGIIPKHSRDDREKEFALMSKGLGKNYLTNNMLYWHKNDLLNRMYINIEDGKKAAMPRYYKDKIYNHSERSEVGGFQKGEIEKKVLTEAAKAYIHQRNIAREQRESQKASFRRMRYNSQLSINNKI